MSVTAGPGIVKDGLVLCLDAANKDSYPGTGTTWIDLSGNNNNGTLTNGPTFNSSNGGSIVFDGTNDYVNAGNLGSFYTQGTINFWMNSSAVENYRNPFHTHYLGNNAGIRFEQYTTISPYGGFTVVIGNDNGATAQIVGDYSPTSILTQNIWYYVTLIWNTTTNKATGYLNSIQKFDASWSYWPTQLPSISIGVGYNNTRYFKGSISATSIYNRTLSSSEVIQNFNAMRGRFGL